MLIDKKIIIYFLLCLSLFLGFFFGENSSGGAKIDHLYLLPFVEGFKISFITGLNSFLSDSGTLIHSPIFYLLIGNLLKLVDNIYIINIFYIILSCFIPFIFHLVISNKYKINSDYIYFFSLLIFLSPYFRTSAIWLLGDNLSLLFFSISVLFFVKTKFQKDSINNYYFTLIFLILCCYIRYYYCLFAIYYLFCFYKNLKLKQFICLITLGILFSIPAIYYLYYILINFNFYDKLSSYGNLNYYSNSLIFLSIIFFYLIPFILTKLDLFFSYYKNRINHVIYLFLIFFLFYLLNKFYFSSLISFSPLGGGVFMKLSKLLNIELELFLSFISFISLLIIDYIFKNDKKKNYLLLAIFILSFPITTIYQKYLDPLFYLVFFGLIDSSYFKDIFINEKINLNLVFAYFFSFYLFSLFYYIQIV
jgi:hypothetical protein